ncbi:GntR family transcriptional regulator [Rhodococcus opacus]|uniref:GntR family transcriptional regulator n=1 Tax=Rhodococcus opacus TaxID=37919 RepID=UPI001C47F17B|nr:GntR family transcriptional regulator [Rhodococcus opacus]MBV6756725.1 GntR family transcriptional regulator [Rhodococcus opacus]
MTRYARLPKYLAIYDHLRSRIESGEWQGDEPLPAQRELAASYCVTIMTLRQALQLLENDGLIELRPGSGTFRTSQKYTYDLLHLSGFAERLTAQGASVDTQVLNVSRQVPPRGVAHALRLTPGTPVLTVSRCRLVDTHPAVLQHSSIPVHFELDDEEVANSSLYEVLARRGSPIVSANEIITVTKLGTVEAEVLSRATNSPAMLSQRTSMTESGIPLVHDTALIPADIAEIRLSRGSQQIQVEYRISKNTSR